MAYENAKVFKSQNPDTFTVASGGSIQILTGGKILPNSGTQATNIVDAVAAAGANPTKEEYDALVTKFNAVLTALKNVGILASS